MNQAIIRSYARSVRRGTRTIEAVPAALRESVQTLLSGEED